MSYALFHNKRPSSVVKYYRTLTGAKIAVAAHNRRAGYAAYEILEEREWAAAHDRAVTVKNLLNGTDVQIPASQVGTCCDPSTERYWSM